MAEAPPRKAFALRLDPALFAAIERSAAGDLRSVNAQVECLLREAPGAGDSGGAAADCAVFPRGVARRG